MKQLDKIQFKSLPEALLQPRGIFAGQVTHLGKTVPVYLPLRGGIDSHLFGVGTSGSGKTNAMLVRTHDYLNRHVFEHSHSPAPGSLVVFAVEWQMVRDEILPYVPEDRIDDVIVINPGDDNPVGLNPLIRSKKKDTDRFVQDNLTIIRRICGETWGPVMKEVFHESFRVAAEVTGMAFSDIKRFLEVQRGKKNEYRDTVLKQVKNANTLRYWHQEYPARYKTAPPSVINKLVDFEDDIIIRNLCQRQNKIDLRDAIDSGKLVLIILSREVCKGHEQLIGLVWFRALVDALFERADVEEEKRPFVLILMDECQRLIPDDPTDLEDLLQRARKYRAGLDMATQTRDNISVPLMRVINGTTAIKLVLPCGYRDAAAFAEEIPGVTKDDIFKLARGQAYLKFWNHPVMLEIPRANPRPEKHWAEEILKRSRDKYGGSATILEPKVEPADAVVESGSNRQEKAGEDDLGFY